MSVDKAAFTDGDFMALMRLLRVISFQDMDRAMQVILVTESQSDKSQGSFRH